MEYFEVTFANDYRLILKAELKGTKLSESLIRSFAKNKIKELEDDEILSIEPTNLNAIYEEYDFNDDVNEWPTLNEDWVAKNKDEIEALKKSMIQEKEDIFNSKLNWMARENITRIAKYYNLNEAETMKLLKTIKDEVRKSPVLSSKINDNGINWDYFVVRTALKKIG